MKKLLNFTSHRFDQSKVDEWEIDYFDVDCDGHKLAEPLLGVRVNEGTWIEAAELADAIQEVKDQRHLDVVFGEGHAKD